MKSLLACVGFIAGCLTAHAGSLAFFGDGKRVAYVEEDRMVLREIGTGVESDLALPDGFESGYPHLTSEPGILWLGGGRRVYSRQTTENAAWKLEFETPEKTTITGLAVNPKGGPLVVVTREEDGERRRLRWWTLLKTGLKEVFIRSVENPEAPVFDASGSLYFCVEHDVWKGDLGEGANDEKPLGLEGVRYWPVAQKKTSSSNGMGTGAQEILPLRQFMLVCNYRIGGWGWGSIDRVPNANAWEGKVSLGGARLLDCGGGSGMALSPDGRHAELFVNDSVRLKDGSDARVKKWFHVDIDSGEISSADKTASRKK